MAVTACLAYVAHALRLELLRLVFLRLVFWLSAQCFVPATLLEQDDSSWALEEQKQYLCCC